MTSTYHGARLIAATALLLTIVSSRPSAQGWDACAPGDERAFGPGPFGQRLGDVADDFTLPVLDGNGDPGASWTYSNGFPTCDVHIFISYFPTGSTSYFEEFWNSSVDDLISVSGIGDAKLAAIRDLVTV